jgi:tetratricopeptide (TPR) repeat protein
VANNFKPKIFIGSSVEGLTVAYAIQQNLSRDVEATVWDQGVFELSMTSLESLTKVLNEVDFGIFVFSPDDTTIMRGSAKSSVRDNVIFEFGLFVGKLGRDRVFFIIPEENDIKTPTDLLGITPGKYDANRQDKSFQAATGPACNQIRMQIKQLGFIRPLNNYLAAGEESESKTQEKSAWITYYMKKDYDKAKEELQKIISQEPCGDVINEKCWLAYINLKMYKTNSLQEMKDLAEENKNKLNTLSLIVDMFMWEDCPDHAFELINNVLGRFPENEEFILLKSRCMDWKGDTIGAKLVLNNSHPEKYPNIAIELSKIYENEKDLISAINVIHSTYLNFPNDIKLVYRYARLLFDSEKHKESLYLLDLLTDKDPKNVEYWGYLSNCCLSLNLYDQAIIACKKAENLSESKASWILMNIGNLNKNKGFYTEAISWLNKGLLIDPTSEYAHGRLAQSIKDKTQEYEDYRKKCKEGKLLLREYKIEKKIFDNQ